jgi:hypothetical protein
VPRLVKGGKWVYGLCVIGGDGRVALPPDAAEEYGFHAGDVLIAMPGSRRSGGFALARSAVLRASGIPPLARTTGRLSLAEPGPLRLGGRLLVAVAVGADATVTMPAEALAGYQVRPGDYLAAARGSYLALALLALGPVMAAARDYPGLPVYRC